MNEFSGALESVGEAPRPAIDFTGEWREFLPIALTNLALTVVTLGIYRFWAKARERRYLWSRTHLVDDTLEWTGTGTEMLVGFLLVMLIVLPAVLFFQFGLQAMILRGHPVAAFFAGAALYVGLFYLYHVARFRALRYQLSRTFWHGIRGGSEEPGWAYGFEAMWRTAIGAGAMGLLMPWANARLWNRRWNSMSFGPYPFTARTEFEPLMKRWLLIYLTPVVSLGLLLALGLAGAGIGTSAGSEEGTTAGAAIGIVAALGLSYLVFLLLSLSYKALFYRHSIGSTKLASVEFAFTASTRDWLKLILGNIGLVIVTLGVGLLFIGYRNWSFYIRHLEARGYLDFEEMTESEVAAPKDAEGLADAFDFGAI